MLCEKAEKGWKSFDLEGKALTAQLLYRTGNQEAARRIVNSLFGYATITDEEIWWQIYVQTEIPSETYDYIHFL